VGISASGSDKGSVLESGGFSREGFKGCCRCRNPELDLDTGRAGL
jgi:hypothetical protein